MALDDGLCLLATQRSAFHHRAIAASRYEWQVEAKGRVIERARHEREGALCKEQERLAALEQRRVELLLKEAEAFRKARDLRY